MCTSCKEVVEGDDDVFAMYCPICSKEFKIVEGHKLFVKSFRSNMDLANKEMFVKSSYAKAHLCYVKAYNINPKSCNAVMGVAISSIRSSTLRHDKIQEATEFFEKNSDAIMVTKENHMMIIQCLSMINHDVDFYIREVKRKLSENAIFFEEEGLKTYLGAIKQAMHFKNYYQGALEKMAPSYSKEFIDNPLTIKKDLIVLKHDVDIDYEVLPSTSPHPMLAETDEKFAISDIIFDSREEDYKKRNASLVLSIVSLVFTIAGLAFILAMPSWLIIGVPLSGVSLICLFIFIIKFLRKEKLFYHKNNCPFIKELD